VSARQSEPGRAGSRYTFVTEWTIDAPIAAVWQEIHDVQQWPSWWRGVVDVELAEAGDDDGVGSYRRMTWKSLLPYKLRFNMRTTRIEGPKQIAEPSSARPWIIDGVADGELCGTGKWTLTPTSAGTHLRYDWTVDATKPWMRALGPIARPAFEWNHDIIMRWGLEGLRRRLRLTA